LRDTHRKNIVLDEVPLHGCPPALLPDMRSEIKLSTLEKVAQALGKRLEVKIA
jgi:hypothetical protein